MDTVYNGAADWGKWSNMKGDLIGFLRYMRSDRSKPKRNRGEKKKRDGKKANNTNNNNTNTIQTNQTTTNSSRPFTPN